MTSSPRVTVAGAGAFGLASALELAAAGCRVTVCDPGGANASGVAAGMIAPVFEAVLDDTARPHFDLLMQARDLWPGFAQRGGLELDRTGALAVGEDGWLDEIAHRFRSLHEWPVELGGAAARALAPGLSQAFGRALLTREDWRVDAPLAMRALTDAAKAAGVVFEARPVTGRGDADVLVVATGADKALAGEAPELSHLSPIKGHIVRLASPSSGAVVRGRGIYAAPGNAMAFGATMEPGAGDVGIDPAKAHALRDAGLRLFPEFADVAFEPAVGVRAATQDGLPMVGLSRAPGVVLATGARRNGWLLAPLVGRLVAAIVTGSDPGSNAARLAPARFPGE
jgi:glycine oxidase